MIAFVLAWPIVTSTFHSFGPLASGAVIGLLLLFSVLLRDVMILWLIPQYSTKESSKMNSPKDAMEHAMIQQLQPTLLGFLVDDDYS